MEIQAAISKVDRYSSPEQGDKVEIIERPNGGISIVMGEGKLAGRRSKAITMKAVHNVITLIGEGVHDCASARVVLSNITNEHRGKADVSLSIISCDLESNTIVVTKNNAIPVVIVKDGSPDFLRFVDIEPDDICSSPSVYQFEIEPETTFILMSDGILQAGTQTEQPINLALTLESILEDGIPSVQEMADTILAQAVSQDTGRPRDDMTVVVLKVSESSTKEIRKEYVRFPINRK